MELLGFDDSLPLFVFNSEWTVFDPVDRPVLASVACPNVDVFNPIELGAALDEPVEQSLVDVDGAGIDKVLVAGVDLGPDADVPERKKTTGTLGKPAPSLEGSEEKKPLCATGVRPRAMSASGRQVSALRNAVFFVSWTVNWDKRSSPMTPSCPFPG